MASRTVAFPIIGLGLDASPLKQGLGDAQSAVASTVAGIQQSANKLNETPFDIYKLKPDTGPVNANVMDIVDRFNARKAAEVAKKAEAANQKVTDARMRDWNAKLPEVSNSLIPKDLTDVFDSLLESEKTAKKITGGLKGQILTALQTGKTMLSQVGGSSIAKGVWAGIDSTISNLGNPLGTWGKIATPWNQGLELAGKVQGLLSSPMKYALAREAGSDAVYEGGETLLKSGSLSGTLARFERTVEETFAGIWQAIDRTFDVQGLMEGFRGGMAGFNAIIEATFGPLKTMEKNPDILTAQFKAGALFVVDMFGNIGKIAIQIYNGFFDVVKLIKTIPGVGGEAPFTEAQEKSIREFQNANKKRVLVPQIGAQDIPMDRNEAIAALRVKGELPAELGKADQGALDKIIADATAGIKNMNLNPGVGQAAEDNARRALNNMTKDLLSGGDALKVANQNFEKRMDEIGEQMRKGGAAVFDEADQAATAATQQRDMAIYESLKPIMQMMDQSKTSTGYEMNSSALVESAMRAQAGQGGNDVQGRIAAASEVQRDILARLEDLQKQALAALKSLPKNPVAFVGPIAP